MLLYDAHLAIPCVNGLFGYPAIPICESHLSAQGIHGLLGRDVLAHGLLLYNGMTKSFTISF